MLFHDWKQKRQLVLSNHFLRWKHLTRIFVLNFWQQWRGLNIVSPIWLFSIEQSRMTAVDEQRMNQQNLLSLTRYFLHWMKFILIRIFCLFSCDVQTRVSTSNDEPTLNARLSFVQTEQHKRRRDNREKSNNKVWTFHNSNPLRWC